MATKKAEKETTEKRSTFFKFKEIGDKVTGTFMHFEKSTWHGGKDDARTSPVIVLMQGDNVVKINCGSIVLFNLLSQVATSLDSGDEIEITYSDRPKQTKIFTLFVNGEQVEQSFEIKSKKKIAELFDLEEEK